MSTIKPAALRSHAILTVFLKEVRENLRDWRTLMSAFLAGPPLPTALLSFMPSKALPGQNLGSSTVAALLAVLVTIQIYRSEQLATSA